MKKKVAIVLTALSVALAGNGEEVRFRETDSVVWLSEKEVYGRFEYQISQNTSVNAILVFPSCVTNISSAAVSGTWAKGSGGGFVRISGSSGSYDVYNPVSDYGIANVLFIGKCPEVSIARNNSTYYVVGRAAYDASHMKYNITASGQFLDCTVWYIEGEDGWSKGGTYCGGVTQPGAARTTMSPFVDEGRFIYHDSDSVTIDMSCINNNAKIYYTLDGTEPTTNSLLYVSPIDVGCATVRAMAYVPEYPFTIISSCSYGQGETLSPIIESANGLEFDHAGNMITLSTATEGATIRYTLDGNEPNERSALYVAPFAISDTVTVKAKAFKENWFDSETVTETFTRLWHRVESPTVTPNNGVFENPSQQVEMSCETEDVEIWYTTDGSDPAVNGRLYKGAFDVYESCMIRAIAKRYDWKDSVETTNVLTRAEGLSEAANLYGYLMETDGTHPWTVVTDVSHDGVSCVKSGDIGNGGITWLQTSLKKAGTVSFWWRAACEEPDVEDGEDGYYDYGAFLVDGNVAARLAGNDTGWQFFSTNITSGGKHVLRWEYSKDGATTYAPDCVWLDQVQWIPADGSGYTLTTPEPVPYVWLSGYGLGLDSDFETAAKVATGKRGGDGRALQVWQDYVAGTDPTNAASVFTAGIEIVDGVPQVTWSPNLNTNGIVRSYTIWGKENLTDAAWHSPTNAADRFFKVSVEMP